VNMARKIADTQERNFGINEASIGGGLLKAAVKMSWMSKRSHTRNVEMSFSATTKSRRTRHPSPLRPAHARVPAPIYALETVMARTPATGRTLRPAEDRLRL
jgi:hypothetical protein